MSIQEKLQLYKFTNTKLIKINKFTKHAILTLVYNYFSALL